MTHAADGDARMPLRKEKQQYVGMLYCLPYVVVFLMGTILPILYALYLSFFKERMVGGSRFVGLKNFVRAVSDAKLWESFGRVSLYFLIQVPLMLALALLAALILDSGRIRHIAIPRMLLFLPYAVPGVIAALMWGIHLRSAQWPDRSVFPNVRSAGAEPAVRRRHAVFHLQYCTVVLYGI